MPPCSSHLLLRRRRRAPHPAVVVAFGVTFAYPVLGLGEGQARVDARLHARRPSSASVSPRPAVVVLVGRLPRVRPRLWDRLGHRPAAHPGRAAGIGGAFFAPRAEARRARRARLASGEGAVVFSAEYEALAARITVGMPRGLLTSRSSSWSPSPAATRHLPRRRPYRRSVSDNGTRKEHGARGGNPTCDARSAVKRTLVKTPPELWAEISDAESLARHLEAFGDIRITRTKPETTVAWEGDRARGTVEIEASGWGTKVTLTAEPVADGAAAEDAAVAAPVPTVAETPDADEEPSAELAPRSWDRDLARARPVGVEVPQPAPEASRRCGAGRPRPRRRAETRAPLPTAQSAQTPRASTSRRAQPAPVPPKRGFFARLFGRKSDPAPVVAEPVAPRDRLRSVTDSVLAPVRPQLGSSGPRDRCVVPGPTGGCRRAGPAGCRNGRRRAVESVEPAVGPSPSLSSQRWSPSRSPPQHPQHPRLPSPLSRRSTPTAPPRSSPSCSTTSAPRTTARSHGPEPRTPGGRPPPRDAVRKRPE